MASSFPSLVSIGVDLIINFPGYLGADDSGATHVYTGSIGGHGIIDMSDGDRPWPSPIPGDSSHSMVKLGDWWHSGVTLERPPAAGIALLLSGCRRSKWLH